MISVGLPSDSVLAADIVFRYLQRLSQALVDRLERLESSASNLTKITALGTVPDPELGPSPGQGSAVAALGLLGTILARVVDRNTPKRRANAHIEAPNRAAADALAAPASVSRG
jgi:hypothetical protein